MKLSLTRPVRLAYAMGYQIPGGSIVGPAGQAMA
jgi:hypothetical protein